MLDDSQWRWLVRHGHRALREYTEILADRASSKLGRATSAKWPSWQQRLIEEQLQLRRRAADRFPNVDHWLWTDLSLQQASDWQSATYKASLFPDQVRVIDACCGAGADTVALAQRHDVVAIDRDRRMLGLTRANLTAHAKVATYCQLELPARWHDLSHTALHLDPDRRQAGQRTTHGEAFSPTLHQSLDLTKRTRAAIIKLAPATDAAEVEQAGFQRCWLGTQRQCPQQLLLYGETGLSWLPAGHVATVLVGHGSEYPVYAGPSIVACSFDEAPSDYIYDPHPALAAAGLVPCWANEHGLRLWPHARGYVTGDVRVTEPWAQCFRVLAHFAWDDRRVRKWLRSHDAGPLEVKTRAVSNAVDANKLQRQYSHPDGQPLVMLLSEVAKSLRVVMAERTSS